MLEMNCGKARRYLGRSSGEKSRLNMGIIGEHKGSGQAKFEFAWRLW